MEDRSLGVFIEHADPRPFRHRILDWLVIINDFALPELFRGERHAVIMVEVAAKRRDPIELPPHPLTKCSELCEWRPRDRDNTDIALVQMDQDAIEIIRPER